MSNEALILVLLSIIGCLLIGIVGYFLKVNEKATDDIKNNVKELKDMFVRHVRNSKIHVNMNHQEEGG